MGDDDCSSLDIEIETLKAIYIHELEINHDDSGRPNCVIVHLYPATADNVTEQFVRLSLILHIPCEYPQDVPDISIRNTRGLSDEEIESIYQATQILAEERKGNAMLFELIEVAKEHLTGINIPSCECAICLYGFANDDVLTKTECYHYFHSHCLARYVRHMLKGEKDTNDEIFAEDQELDTMIACPVCRLPVSFPLSDKKFPPPAESEKVDLLISMEQKKLQEEMQELFIKQKEKGGIIDLEAERNRFLIEISAVPDLAASNDNIETMNQQIEERVTEHKESLEENLVKTAKIGSEAVSDSEENHLEESYEDRNKYSKPPMRNLHKQHGTFSNKSERHMPLEKNLECVNSIDESSNIQQNESKFISVGNKVRTNDAIADIQREEVISRSGHGYNRTMQRGKMPYRGPNKRHFRGNRYPRQVQNRDRHSYNKSFPSNQHEYKDETESYLQKQSSTNPTIEHSNKDADRILGSQEDSSEINAMERPKSSRIDTDIYRERKNDNRVKHFRRNSKRHETTDERGECSGEKKNEYIEESGFVKNVGMSRNTEKGDRQYFSGRYPRNYRSEQQQRFRHDFQREEYVKNTQNKDRKFLGENAGEQNTEYQSPKHEIMRKNNDTVESGINNPHDKDMPRNQNRSKLNMEDLKYSKRDQNKENGDRKFNNNGPKLEHDRSSASYGRKFRQNYVKECSETRNIDHSMTDSKSYTNEVSLQEASAQKMGIEAHVELNESDSEVTSQLLTKDTERSSKEENFKNINTRDNNSYRGKYNNRRGFRNRVNNRQYRYRYEDRENCGSKSFSEHKSGISQNHVASKNEMNKELSVEIAKPSSSVHETTVQLESQFNETECENMLQSLKNEEKCKNTNANDRNSYRGRSRGRRGFHYRTNERWRYTPEDGDDYKDKTEFESRDNKRELSEHWRKPQNSTDLILVETNTDGEDNWNNVTDTVPRTGPSKSTKHRNLYFYPKSRGNYRSDNRTVNEVNNTRERHRHYSKGNSNDVDSVDTSNRPESKKLSSHR